MVGMRQKYRGGDGGGERGQGDEAGESNQNGKRMIGEGSRRGGRHNAVRDVGWRGAGEGSEKTKRDDRSEE